MTEPQVLISVLIPAYNAGRYIKEAIDSVKRQNADVLTEIIVADDESADDTVPVAASLDCTVLSLSHKGAAAARNAAFAHASGKYIFMLDADDIATPDAFALLLEPFAKKTGLEVAFGKAVDFISPELTKEEAGTLKPQNTPYTGILPGCSLIRKEAFDRIGFFDESLKSGETVEWMIRSRNALLRSVQIDEVTLKRRLHMTNTGRRNRHGELADYAALLRKGMKK